MFIQLTSNVWWAYTIAKPITPLYFLHEVIDNFIIICPFIF